MDNKGSVPPRCPSFHRPCSPVLAASDTHCHRGNGLSETAQTDQEDRNSRVLDGNGHSDVDGERHQSEHATESGPCALAADGPASECDGGGQSDGDDGPIGDGMADESSNHQRRGGSQHRPPPLAERLPRFAHRNKNGPNMQRDGESPVTVDNGNGRHDGDDRRGPQSIGPIGLGEIESDEAGKPASVVRHDNSRDRGLWRQV